MVDDRRERFVTEYLRDQNGTAAAIRAGYGAAGARVTASRLLSNPNIRAKIDAVLQAERAQVMEHNTITKAEIVSRLVPLVRTSMQDLVTVGEDGTASLNLKALTPEQWASIRELRYDKAGRPIVKLYDRRAAAFDLAQILGFIVQKHQVRKINSAEDLSDDELRALLTDQARAETEEETRH